MCYEKNEDFLNKNKTKSHSKRSSGKKLTSRGLVTSLAMRRLAARALSHGACRKVAWGKAYGKPCRMVLAVSLVARREACRKGACCKDLTASGLVVSLAVSKEACCKGT